jgi:hypothetical protein
LLTYTPQCTAQLPSSKTTGSGVAEATRRAEADLEEIRFTVLLDEQRPAAVFRLDALRTAIVGAAQPPPFLDRWLRLMRYASG